MSEQRLPSVSPHELVAESFQRQVANDIRRTGNPQQYIHEILLPMMNEHRGRETPMTVEEVHHKLFSTESDKPGELAEFVEQRRQGQVGEGLNAGLALEIADLMYYLEQPASRDLLYGSPEERNVPFDRRRELEILLGVTLEKARLFCIYKYRTRMEFAHLDDERRKRMEALVIERVF